MASAPRSSNSAARSASASFSALASRARKSRLEALFDDLLGLIDEGRDHLVFGHDANDLALDKEVAAVLTRGDPEVGVTRFARSVHDTAHHRDL